MADWNKIKENVSVAANKAIKKTGEIADIASKYVKLKNLDSKISSRFEELGRLTYKQIKEEQSQAGKISAVIVAIDKLREARNALNEEIEAEKKRRAEEKAAAKAQAEAQRAAEARKAAEEAAKSADDNDCND